MSSYLGDFAEDATVYIPFNTFDSNDPAASVTVTSLTDAMVHVHKDGSATQIIDANDGVTVSKDFDTVTGNHLITIDTSAHADYATGSDYQVRIEGLTVDAGTLNVWVGSFSIQNRYSAGALRPTTAGRTLDVSATGEAGLDWANIGSPTTAQDLSGTDIQLCDTITTYTGNTLQTGDVTTAINDLANGTDGLTALKAILDTSGVKLANVAHGGAAATIQMATTTLGALDATTITTTSNVSLGGTLTVASTVDFQGNLAIAGSLTVGSNFTVTSTTDFGALHADTKAEINAEVVDALNVDTYAEPGQGTPLATTSLAAKINYLYKNWRNKKTQTATTWELLNDDAVTVDQKATVADAAGTASKTEVITGP